MKSCRMDLEGIALTEVRQRKTNTLCSHLHVKSKTNEKPRLLENTTLVVARGGGLGVGKMGEEGSEGINF